MSWWRKTGSFIAELLDKVREPGWPRRIAIIITIALIMYIPYPLSITGEFEVISLKPVATRTRVEGTVSEILVKMADPVKAGQVVARLLDVELKLERGKVAAELAEGEAQLRLARAGYRKEEIQIALIRVKGLRAEFAHKQTNLQRETALFAAKDIPKARLDDAKNELLQAKKNLGEAAQELHKLSAGYREEEIAQAAARVEQLKGLLATTDQHIEWTEIKAPTAGYVVTPDQELQKLYGARVPSGAALIEIVDPKDLVARLAIPEKEFGDVKLGQTVTLRAFQYPGSNFDGTVVQIEPQVEQVDKFSSMVPVNVRVNDATWSQLRVHTKGRAKIALGSSSVGYVLYRRVLRSAFVNIWSWY